MSTTNTVYIGTPVTDFSNINDALFVNGRINANAVNVVQNNWPDFVFAENYELTPLNEVEDFIKENHHLPEVPNAQQVSEDGVDLGKMNALFLKKIEELTLYMLEQDKKNEEQEVRIKLLEMSLK